MTIPTTLRAFVIVSKISVVLRLFSFPIFQMKKLRFNKLQVLANVIQRGRKTYRFKSNASSTVIGCLVTTMYLR
jgi:hypothetical protein